jgi:hypothetical protein
MQGHGIMNPYAMKRKMKLKITTKHRKLDNKNPMFVLWREWMTIATMMRHR